MSSRRACLGALRCGGGQSGAAAKRTARLRDATRVGDCGAMERLIDGGLDINATSETVSKGGDKHQATALCAAVAHKHEAALLSFQPSF